MTKKDVGSIKAVSLAIRRPLEYVAFWQFMGFLMLIMLIWVNETWNLAAVFFGEDTAPRYRGGFSAAILTSLVIVIGFVTIAHTFIQQKTILKGFVRVCSYCRKVKIDEQAWEQIEEFVAERTLAEFTHGICPACYEQLIKTTMADANARDKKNEDPPAVG